MSASAKPRMVQIAGRRAVNEWIADHPDQDIPKRVKVRIWERCEGRCHITGAKIDAVRDQFDFEHIRRLADDGEHRELNIALALRIPHRAKTARENSDGAKADRARLKHMGLWKKSKRPLRSRNTLKGRNAEFGSGW